MINLETDVKGIVRRDLQDVKVYEPGKPIFEVERELGLKEVIKLASNESPYPPFPKTLSAIHRNLEQINRYPDGDCTLLKQRLATFLEVFPENVMIGHGSNELIRLISQVVISPKDEAIMGTPSFVVYPAVTKIMGGKVREIPLKDYRLDLKAMLRAVNEKTKIVFICNPNNPTGTVVYKQEVDEFLAKIPENILVLFDEAYFEYVENGKYPDSLRYFRQGKMVACLRTFSKIYSLAGLRIGYGVADKELVSVVNKVREPFNVNVLAQVAALSSLDCREEVKRRKFLNAEGKKALYKEFERLGLKYVPSEANFILVDVGRNCREIFEKLLKKGVIVRAGDIFGKGYQTFLRVAIGTPAENKKFIQALEKTV